MHFVYILYSPIADKLYVGESVNPSERTQQHNTKFYKTASTSFTADWTLLLTIPLNTRQEALSVEKYITKKQACSKTVKLIFKTLNK
jgi:putative endonuclease